MRKNIYVIEYRETGHTEYGVLEEAYLDYDLAVACCNELNYKLSNNPEYIYWVKEIYIDEANSIDFIKEGVNGRIHDRANSLRRAV